MNLVLLLLLLLPLSTLLLPLSATATATVSYRVRLAVTALTRGVAAQDLRDFNTVCEVLPLKSY